MITVKSTSTISKDEKDTRFKLLTHEMREVHEDPNFTYVASKEEIRSVFNGEETLYWNWQKGKTLGRGIPSNIIRHDDGSITAGCQKFSKEMVAKIRKWAFAKRKKVKK